MLQGVFCNTVALGSELSTLKLKTFSVSVGLFFFFSPARFFMESSTGFSFTSVSSNRSHLQGSTQALYSRSSPTITAHSMMIKDKTGQSCLSQKRQQWISVNRCVLPNTTAPQCLIQSSARISFLEKGRELKEGTLWRLPTQVGCSRTMGLDR